MPIRFSKYHALGNDYLILDPKDLDRIPQPQVIERICHRNFGLGSDGILWGPGPTTDADFSLRIFNPDGSEAEKSGNGLRIFARYLFDTGQVGNKPFTVHTPGGKVTCELSADGETIAVEMGRVSFDSTVIPVNGPAREVLNEELEVDGRNLHFYAATVGNPHCVVPVDTASAEECRHLGPLLERHPLFPNRTNVQFLEIIDRNAIRIEIWERGAGYTLASGSSSSAAAAVAHKMGACDDTITVHMPGGTIGIRINPDFAITMTGPATRVGEFFMDDGLLLTEG